MHTPALTTARKALATVAATDDPVAAYHLVRAMEDLLPQVRAEVLAHVVSQEGSQGRAATALDITREAVNRQMRHAYRDRERLAMRRRDAANAFRRQAEGIEARAQRNAQIIESLEQEPEPKRRPKQSPKR